MQNISRHIIDLEIANKRLASLEELLPLIQKAVIENSDRLNMLFNTAKDYISYLIVTNNPDPIKIKASLKTAIETATAIFKLASASEGETVQVIINDQKIDYIFKKITGAMDSWNWRYGFYFSIIAGDFDTADFLCTIPTNTLRASSTKSDEATYLFIDALQALWKKDNNVLSLLEKALEATDPKVVKLGIDYVLNILVPEIELLWRFATRDAEGFNKALYYALKLYKKYWGSKEYKFSSTGFIAYNLLAYTSLAYDAEIAIEIESDYLLKAFYIKKYSLNA